METTSDGATRAHLFPPAVPPHRCSLSLASTANIAAGEDVFSQQTARDGFDETVPLSYHLEFVGLSFVFPLGFLWLWVSFLSTSSG